MKTCKHIILVLAGLLLLASCDKREPALTNIVPCVIGDVPTEALDINSIMKERKILFKLEWTPAQFITEKGAVPTAPLIYSIEFDKYGNGFNDAKPYAIIQGDATSFEIPVMDFSVWVLSNIPGARAGSPVTVEIRIKVQYGDAESYTYSANAKPLTIIPFGVQPMYIIGDWNDWNTADATYRMFRDNNDESDFTMVYVGRIKTEFKFIAKGSLGTQDMYYKKSDTEMAAGVHEGDAFTVPVEGYYEVRMNIMDMTYSIKPYDVTGKKVYTSVGFMGAWCSWTTTDPNAQLTQSPYNPHLWYGTFDLSTVEYGVKFCGNKGWGDKWQPSESTTEEIPYGVAFYNYVNPDDPGSDPNFSLGSASGTYFTSLNDLTGHYIIEKKN